MGRVAVGQGSAATPSKASAAVWWWLPPVIWPAAEEDTRALLERLLRGGARRFVLNDPWQAGLFAHPEKLTLWAGPFCNLANPLALDLLEQAGFAGAFVSPELGRETFLELPKISPLPLGMVLTGLWPLALSRVLSEAITRTSPSPVPGGSRPG